MNFSGTFSVSFLIMLLGANPGLTQKRDTGLFGRNLLRNPGAEAEVRSNIVPDWTPGDAVEVSEYGHTSGEWDWGVSGAPNGGKQYFRLTFSSPEKSKSVTQTVDVSSAAKSIDDGSVLVTLSGYFGGIVDPHTSSQLTAVFLDANGKELGTLSTDPPQPQELPKPRTGSASLVIKENSVAVPVGTRSILVRLTAIATDDSGGDYLGLADNLALLLRQKR